MPVVKGEAGESTPGGLTPGTVVCSPSVKRAYSIVRRCTGSLGGNGSGGAIYGELTSGSMQKASQNDSRSGMPLPHLGRHLLGGSMSRGVPVVI